MTRNILLTIPNFRTAGSQYVLLSLYHLYKVKHPGTFVLIEDETGLFPPEVETPDRLIIPKRGYLGLRDGIKYSIKLAKCIASNGIGVVHSWDYRSEIWEALACKFAGIPYVYTKKNNAWSKKWFLKSMLTSHIAYDHPDMGRRYFSNPLLNKKASLIPHGVDTAVFKPGSGNKERSFVIGCIGNIGANKNQMTILKALAECGLNLQCHFYGNAEPEYFKALQDFISGNKIKDKVEFRGFVANAQLPEVIKSFDILILASYNEGLPVILLEAMACGVYCIASDSGGGSRYILENCRHGDLFDPYDYIQLSKLIKKFYLNPAPGQSTVENAFNSIREHFSTQKEAENYLSLFSRL